MTSSTTHGFDSRAVHAGQHPDATTGAVIPPVHFSSTYVQDGIGNLREGYEYGRSGNPTRTALERQLAAIEGAEFGLSFASGLAAEDALLRALLAPGDEVLIGNDAYGGSYRLIARLLGPWGVRVRVADLSDPAAVAAALQQSTPRLVWVETPSNPLLRITDIAALSRAAHEAGALLVVDNTFASPALQQPIALGADVVVHSATKYLGGHSDVVGGALVTSSAAIYEKAKFLQFAAGAVSGPLDAWLTTRGIKTLGIRMQRHSENAGRIAQFLDEDARVATVYYPGLAHHPGHAIATAQMSGFGGIVSLEVGSSRHARHVAESTRLFTLAESLGGVESLVNYPDEMTHASVRGTELAVPDTIVRLSVGIESIDDLLEDLDRALG
ncbi:cystathionine gamma-synthase [Microbacterium sediminicola]|uniref:Cystathionine gamma-synthase n=1 Tax=Microbacterium sediminicola TaxID=415210 RepID=A0ABP4U851_9MICO